MIIDVHTHIFESLDALPEVWIANLYRSKISSIREEAAKKWKRIL